MLYKKTTNKQLMMLFMLLVSATAQAAFDCDSVTWGSCDQEQGFTCNTGNNIPWVCCNVPRPDRSCDDGMCWTNSNVCPTDRCLTKQDFCQNGSTCQEGTCVCEGGFSGVFCEIPLQELVYAVTWDDATTNYCSEISMTNDCLLAYNYVQQSCADLGITNYVSGRWPSNGCYEAGTEEDLYSEPKVLPTSPGCYVKWDTCSATNAESIHRFHPLSEGTLYRLDGWGHENANSNANQTACDARLAPFQNWCVTDGIEMYFVPEGTDAYIALDGFGQCGSLAGGAMLDRDINVWYNDPNTDTREKCEAHCNNEPDCYAYSWKASYTDCSIHLDNCEPVDSYYNVLSGPSEWGNPDYLAASFVSQEDIVSSGSDLGQGHSDALCYVRQDWEPVNEFFIKQFSNGEYCGHHGRELSEEECLKFTEWTVDQPQILPNATCRDCSPVDCEGIECFFKHYWGGVVTELAQPRSCSRNSRDWINFNTVGSAMSGEAVCVAVCPTNCESDENCWRRLATEDCGDIESWYRSSGRFLDNDGKAAFMLDTYNIALGALDDARIDVLKASFLGYCNDISGRRRKL